MFGKLLKHEFRATRRLVPFVWLATLVMAVLNIISGQIGIKWLSGTSLVFLLLLAAGQVLVTYIVIITRYYRSLYTDEGYLTHTIPAKAGELLGTKVLSSFIWIILSIFISVIVLAVVLIYFAKENGTSVSAFYNEIQSMIGFETKDVIIAAVLLLLFVSFSILSQLAQMFFSMSFGSLAKFQKLNIAAPIICYLILNFILEMLTMVAMVFIPFGIQMKVSGPNQLPVEGGTSLVARGMIHMINNPETQDIVFGLGGIAFMLIATFLLYLGTYNLIKKKTSLR